jgi:ribonuclease HI
MGCLTIYTDASYNHKTKVAGYGFWSRDKTFIAKGSGSETNIRCNTYAEIRAIAFAVFT